VRRPPLWIVSGVAFVVAWQLLSLVAGDNRAGEATVPGILEIAGAAKDMANYWRGGLGVEATNVGGEVTWAGAALGLLYNTALTFMRLLGGLFVGSLAGIGLAVAVSWSGIMRDALSLPAHFSRMLPLLAMVPLFGLWFGNSNLGAILFVGFATFVLLFASALTAIGSVPAYYANYARSLGASGMRTYMRVVLPAALPGLKGGVLLAVAFSWSAVIAAEFVGQQFGLGRIVFLSSEYGQTDMLALSGFVLVLCAGASYLLAFRILNRLTRWA
jgi:sulfonate transport system permease protein